MVRNSQRQTKSNLGWKLASITLNRRVFVLLFSLLEWYNCRQRQTSWLVPSQALLAVYSKWVQFGPVPCKLCANSLFLCSEPNRECLDRMWQQFLWNLSLPWLLARILCHSYSRSWLPQSLRWSIEIRWALGRDWLGEYTKCMLAHSNFTPYYCNCARWTPKPSTSSSPWWLRKLREPQDQHVFPWAFSFPIVRKGLNCTVLELVRTLRDIWMRLLASGLSCRLLSPYSTKTKVIGSRKTKYPSTWPGTPGHMSSRTTTIRVAVSWCQRRWPRMGWTNVTTDYIHFHVISLLTGNMMNALIACRSFFAGVKLPDGHDDMASEEADNDLCNLVAAAISVGYWAPLVKVTIFYLRFAN